MHRRSAAARLAAAIALAALIVSAPARAGSPSPGEWLFWRQVIDIGYPRSAAYDAGTDGTMLVVASGDAGEGIYRSTDDGKTWGAQQVWTAPTDAVSFRVTAGSSPGVFFAWGGISIYETTDGGVTWAKTGYGSPCNTIDRLYPHPSNPSIVYASTRSGLARSFDGGATWEGTYQQGGCLSPGLQGILALGAGVDQPDVLYAGMPYGFTGGVYRSANRGTDWQAVSSDIPLDAGTYPSIVDLAVDPRDSDHVFALTESGALYETADAGGSWARRADGLPQGAAGALRAIELDSSRDDALYAVSETQLYQLPDGATAWLPTASLKVRPMRVDDDPLSLTRLWLTIDPTGRLGLAAGDSFTDLWYTTPEVGTAHLPLTVR